MAFIAQNNLATSLIKIIDFLSVSDANAVNANAPSDVSEPINELSIFSDLVYKLLCNFVVHEPVINELKKSDSISGLIRIITSKGSPEECFTFQKLYVIYYTNLTIISWWNFLYNITNFCINFCINF